MKIIQRASGSASVSSDSVSDPGLLPDEQTSITALLQLWTDGDAQGLELLIPRVYAELRGIARQQLRREAPGHTLQPTAIVHEVYARMATQGTIDWQDRRHFFAVATTVMRRILVDHARARMAAKRGGGLTRADELGVEVGSHRGPQLVAVDSALTRLQEIDPHKARIVQLRFFGGFSLDEVAQLLGCSRATIVRQWRVARAWLYRELDQEIEP